MKTTKTTLNPNSAPIRIVFNPFDVRARLAAGHACGGWDEKFKTAVSLECRNLDENGFVIENLTFIRRVRKPLFYTHTKATPSNVTKNSCTLLRFCYFVPVNATTTEFKPIQIGFGSWITAMVTRFQAVQFQVFGPCEYCGADAIMKIKSLLGPEQYGPEHKCCRKCLEKALNDKRTYTTDELC